MEWCLVTWHLYRTSGQRAGKLLRNNWAIPGTVFLYIGTVLGLYTLLAALPFGIIGGLILSAGHALIAGSFLYLLDMLVRTSRVTMADIQRSVGAYFGEVLGVVFLLWILRMFLTPLLLSTPQGPLLLLALNALIFILLNAVPEMIYLHQASSTELLTGSISFITTNWLEWLPVIAAQWALLNMFPGVWGFLALDVEWFATLTLWSVAWYYLMILRGLLYAELSASGYRARAFRYRAGGTR